MIFDYVPGVLLCTCGFAMEWKAINQSPPDTTNGYLTCSSIPCKNYGKKFKLPTIELEEIKE